MRHPFKISYKILSPAEAWPFSFGALVSVSRSQGRGRTAKPLRKNPSQIGVCDLNKISMFLILPVNVRFWEKSGHWDRQQECLLLTRSAHLQPHFLSNCHDGGWGMSNQQQQSLSFGVIDRPECPYCGERAYLTRRSPHPDHDLRYELQVFTCSACDHTIERIVDANGNPPAELKCCD
jgi:hypothetical protein